ncbi:hypothetical protein QTP88_014501 [Uroleucon formosanum]
MPICPGAHRKDIVKDLILRDSNNARIFRTMGEHLERNGLLTIAKILACESYTIRKLPQGRELMQERASRIAQHSAVNEETKADKLEDDCICNSGRKEFEKDEHFNINLPVSQRYRIDSGGQEDSTFSTEIGVDFNNPSAVRKQLACSEFNFL